MEAVGAAGGNRAGAGRR